MTATDVVANGAAAAALLALAAGLLALTRHAAGRWLAAYVGVVGIHFASHAAVFALWPSRLAQAALNAGHLPWFYSHLLVALFVTSFTGTHARFWRRPLVLAAAALLPTLLVLVELASPDPFWTATVTGETPAATPWRPWASLDLAFLTATTAYAIVLLARSLARETVPADVAGRALMLAGFLIPAVLLVRDATWNAYPTRFLELVGATPATFLTNEPWIQVPLAIVLSVLPYAIVRRSPDPHIRQAGLAAVLLAATVSAVVAESGAATRSLSALRWVVFAVLLAYGALRHGFLGAARVVSPRFELPLAALGFGIVALLFVATLSPLVPAAFAVTGGLTLALLAGSLAVSLSGAEPLHRAAGPRYREERELGRGSRGQAILALDRRLHRSVVLKRLPPGRAALNEARAAAGVSHPSLVAIHDVVEDGSGTTLVMEYLPGGTLEDRLRAGPLPRSDARRLGLQIAEGLDALHRSGIVHGDVKAGNVFFRADARAALGDFGIARRAPSIEETVGSLGETATSGSLAGVAPEVLRREIPDARADVYGLGALLYRCLTGQSYVLFPPNLEEARNAVLHEPPRLPHAAVPRRWEALLSMALAKRPAQRHPTVGDLVAELEGVEAA